MNIHIGHNDPLLELGKIIDVQQSNATAIRRFLRKTGLPLGALVALLI
jgi:hypothetical protein